MTSGKAEVLSSAAFSNLDVALLCAAPRAGVTACLLQHRMGSPRLFFSLFEAIQLPAPAWQQQGLPLC